MITLIVGALIGGLLALVGGLVMSLASDELSSWAVHCSSALVRAAIKQLPEGHRNRYDEEWTAELSSWPGPVSKLLFALSLYFRGAKQLARVVGEPVSAAVGREEFVSEASLDRLQADHEMPFYVVELNGADYLVRAEDVSVRAPRSQTEWQNAKYWRDGHGNVHRGGNAASVDLFPLDRRRLS